jgi:O-antigen ligase
LFNRSLSRRVQVLLALSILLGIWWLWILLGTQIASLVGLSLALLVITWLRAPRIGLLVTGLFVLSILLFPNQYFQKFYTNKLGSYNRVDIWTSMVDAFGEDQPLLGLGPATYSWYAMAGGMEYRQSHSNYVDLFLQFGLVGLGCFLAVFLAVLKEAWGLRKRWAWGFEKGYAVAVIGGVCGALAGAVLADWVLPQVYNIGFAGFRHTMFTWFLSGGLVALGNFKREA